MNYGHVVISNTKKGFVQAAIRWITGSKYSHSFFTIPPICGKEMGAEAAGSGVSCVAFDTHYRQNPGVSYKAFRVKAPQEAVDVAIGDALEHLQDGYGYLEIPWFIWRAFNKHVLRRDIRNQNNWCQAGTICSELTAQYLSDCGFPYLFAAFGKGAINAQDVLEVCEAHPELFELIETKE